MRVRTPHAERSRIPRQCQSSGGKSDPKGKPSGDPDGKQVNIPSYLVKAGDTIEIKEKHKASQRYKDILEVTGGRLVPEWLDADQDNLKGVVKAAPSRDMIDVPVNEMLIVELYSK